MSINQQATPYALRIQRWYTPILNVLALAGGRAPTLYVNKTLERNFGDLIPIDGYELNKKRIPRWKTEVSLAAKDLSSDPTLIIRSDGWWTLTEDGYEVMNTKKEGNK